MKPVHSDILKKLRSAERRLQSLSRESQTLESEKGRCLQEIMRGQHLFREVKETDQLLEKKSFAISKARKEVNNLRAQLAGQLAQFKRDLIEEKQKELDHYLEQRTRYLKRIEELELEISRYRYLVTGKKDRHLANVKNLVPSEIRRQKSSAPIDEAIGHIKLEVHRITRMSSEELLKEYLSREKKR
jgi:hypothetical protein